MLHRNWSIGGTLRVATAAFMLGLLVMPPPAFAKGGPGPDKGKHDDKHSVPNCNRGNQCDHDDDRPGRAGEDKLFCPNKQVVVRIDEKLCPEKPGRPAVIRKRVCCRHGSLTNCRPFRPCPPRSRS
jgi:hypothetical protein